MKFKWINLIVILLLIISSFTILNEIYSHPDHDHVHKLVPQPGQGPITTQTTNQPQTQTRTRYLDDIIMMDDPEVQLMVYPGDANDCNYGSLSFGKTIATGDIDNDGYNDLILGVPFADGPTDTNANCGQVMVIFGGEQTHSMSKYDQAIQDTDEINLVIHGSSISDYSGYCIASGNIDGDDYDDIIISAPYADGKSGGRPASGEVYVIYGNQRQILGTEINLQNTAPDLIIYGAAGGASPGYDAAGYSLTVGNVIGDSRDDIIIGAPYGNWTNRTNCGKVHVVAGNTRGNLGTELDLLTESDVTLYGARADDYIGWSVVSGDINGDLRDDIVIGGYTIDPYGTRANAGAVYVVYGAQTLPATIDLDTNADISFFGATASDYYGWAMAMGNINGDQYEDLVVSALYGDGNNDALPNCGDVYIKYGAPNLLSQYDLNTDGYDVTLYGKNSWDYFGYSLATGNVNNDQYDDLLLGVYGGDGDQDGNLNCGEAYLIFGNSTANLGTNLDPVADAETVFYGIDSLDYLGRAVHLGDLDADEHDDVFLFAPAADGPNNDRDLSGEFYTIYSQPPPMKNEFLKLIDGDIDNKTIFSRYKGYTFRINVSNILDYKDIKWVTLILDPGGYNISLRWTRVGLEFSEVRDAGELVELLSLGSDTNHDNGFNYSIDFKLNLNWTFNKTGPIDCKVISLGEKSLRSETFYEDVFQVNNKLDLIGALNVEGAIQGELDEYSWLQGGEELTFNGLKAVYHNTTNIYPLVDQYSIGLNFNGDLEEYPQTDITPGQEIVIGHTAPMDTGDYLYKIFFTDIPEFCDLSSKNIYLKIDADAPPATTSVVCKADSVDELYEAKVDDDREFFIVWNTVNDVGSGTAGYFYSTEKLTGNEIDPDHDNWTLSTSDKILNAPEGLVKIYVWAKDGVGNIGPAGVGEIFIDLTQVTFANFQPKSTGWFTSDNITCSIQIMDINGFGVNQDDIWYWSELNSKWIKISNVNSTDPRNVNISITAQMKDGVSNNIKFRASDLAGNGPTISQEYFFKVDTIPVTYSQILPNPDKKGNAVLVKCYVTVNDLGGSGVNLSTIQYSYTTSGSDDFFPWTDKDLAMITNLSSSRESSRWFVELKFRRGAENFIRWRAKDVAGNGYTESEMFKVRINAFPEIKISSVEPNGVYSSSKDIEFSANETTDPDDDLKDSAFSWNSNISGLIGKGRIIKAKLPAGRHHISLTVNDGLSNTTLGFNITVQEPTKPGTSTDGDEGFLGFDEITSFFIIIILIIIILLFLFIYSRERKKRKALEEKALGLEGTYIPPRTTTGTATLTPDSMSFRGPQLYDATVSPTGISGVGTIDQLPASGVGTQPPYGVGAQTSVYQPQPQQQPEPVQQLPGAAPITTPAGEIQARKPQLPPASIYSQQQQQQQRQKQPEAKTVQPKAVEAQQPYFGAPLELGIDQPATVEVPDVSLPPEPDLTTNGAIPRAEDSSDMPILEPVTDEEAAAIEQSQPQPVPMPQVNDLEPKQEPEQITKPAEPKPKHEHEAEPEEKLLGLGLTPDSPEYQKRLKEKMI